MTKLVQQFLTVLEHKQILPSMGETQQRLADECRKALAAPPEGQPFLKELCEALGWQGGTIWDALAEVRRLKRVEKDADDWRDAAVRIQAELSL